MIIQELINLITFSVDPKSLEEVQKSTEKVMKKIEDGSKKMIMAFSLPFLAMSTLAAKLAAEQAEALAQVQNAYENTNGTVNRTMEELQSQAKELEGTTLASQTNILRDVTSQLIGFSDITEEQFDRAQKAVIDMTAKVNPSMENLRENSMKLGRALQNPAEEMGNLGEIGVRFNQQQQEMIKNLVASGKKLDAQKFILKEVEKRFKGSAEAVAKNSTGFKRLWLAGKNILMLFGNYILPVFQKVSYIALDLSNKLSTYLSPSVIKTTLIFGSLVALLPVLILGMVLLAKAGMVVVETFAMITAAAAAQKVGVIAMLGKYGLYGAIAIAVLGALYLILEDIMTYLDGGESVIGGFLEPWATLGPELKQSLSEYLKIIMILVGNIENLMINLVQFITNIISGDTAKASENIIAIIKNMFSIIGGLVAILIPVLINYAIAYFKTMWVMITGYYEKFIQYILNIGSSIVNAFKSSIIDPIFNYVANKIDALVSNITNIAPFLPKIISGFGGGLMSGGLSAAAMSSTSTSKNINVTVNSTLEVPQGTPDTQKGFLENTVKQMFENQINGLTRQINYATPAVK